MEKGKITKILKLKKQESPRNGSGRRSAKDILILKSQLARYLALGLTIEESTKLTGIRGKMLGSLRSDPEFEDFIQKCTIQNKQRYLESIQIAADNGYWQAAAWYLERKFPEEFGKKDIVKHQYEVKLMTLQAVILKVINDIDPVIKAKVLVALKNYEWNGEGCMDNSFQSLPSPKDEDNFIDMNEFCTPETIDV